MNRIEFTKFPPLAYASEEAFNTLCTNLTFTGQNVKKIMVTSSHASEGKSTISMNLLRSMAGRGKTAVLVDADIRRSMIGAQYGAHYASGAKRYGLSHYLAGMAESEDVLYETNIPGAAFVPMGRTLLNPIPLLASQRFCDLLDRLTAQYDYVFVDAAPVGVVIDAAEIARFCDGILLVVDYNVVHRQELIDAKTQLEQTGCPILGAVLNKVEYDDYASKKYYYKSYRSGYYGGYASTANPQKEQGGKA